MGTDSKGDAPPAKEGEGFLRRLFGGSEHHASEPDAKQGPGDESTLELADIQGFILRGYRMPMVRHFLLSVGVAAEARKLLGRLVSGDESDAPQITTADIDAESIEQALAGVEVDRPHHLARILR